MALKFLNKKGWHTGSLRNIENVWKAEQKHDAEQRKLEEIRKQIQEEKERFEFRLLQEKAGLVPRQERLEFLYESGLAVGKSIASSSASSGVTFKAPEEPAPAAAPVPASAQPGASATAAQETQSTPGALFEDKPQSANDAWRKLHSDPLLLIRQREQEAIARIKNNPIQMAPILKQIDEVKRKEERRKKKRKKREASYSEESDAEERRRRERRKEEEEEKRRREEEEEERHRRRKKRVVHRMTEEERAAKRREMEMNAEMHEEQRWKRVKKADEDDAKEALNSSKLKGRNFLEAAQKSVYGTGKGGCSTIEESVRRRAYYSQRSSADGNAFRR